MGATDRNATAAVIARLRSRPAAFDAFQALRLLDLDRLREVGHERARPVGYDHAPGSESIRLRGSPSLAFSPGALREVREGEGGRLEVSAAFLALVGSHGPLPAHYSELELERLARKDPALRDWLDLFHHRALSFAFRVWRKYRLPFAHEHALRAGDPSRPDEGRRNDPFERVLAALVGHGTEGLPGLHGNAGRAWIAFAGHFSRASRTADGLASLVRAFVGAPARVCELAGRWIELGPGLTTRLSARGDGRNSRLGREAILGTRAWDVRSTIRIELGPLDRRRFAELAPDGAVFPQLREIVCAYVDGGLDVDLDLLLPAESPRASALGAGARLGYSAWLEAPAQRRRAARVRLALYRR